MLTLFSKNDNIGFIRSYDIIVSNDADKYLVLWVLLVLLVPINDTNGSNIPINGNHWLPFLHRYSF